MNRDSRERQGERQHRKASEMSLCAQDQLKFLVKNLSHQFHIQLQKSRQMEQQATHQPVVVCHSPCATGCS